MMEESKLPKRTTDVSYRNPPKTLDDHIFFGLRLDESQKKMRQAIWDDDIDIVFVDAMAGSGKTTIAVATSVLAKKYGKINKLVYIMNSVGEAQGYLPGTISEKSSVWFEPLYQALIEANEDPERVICNSSMAAQKEGDAYVTALTTTYIRGSNIGNGEGRTFMIVDEAQNYDEFTLRKTLTRACAGTKVIVIGHTLQCDLPSGKKSGFKPCMDHFAKKNDPRAAFIELTTNHRSWVANVADEQWT